MARTATVQPLPDVFAVRGVVVCSPWFSVAACGPASLVAIPRPPPGPSHLPLPPQPRAPPRAERVQGLNPPTIKLEEPLGAPETPRWDHGARADQRAFLTPVMGMGMGKRHLDWLLEGEGVLMDRAAGSVLDAAGCGVEHIDGVALLWTDDAKRRRIAEGPAGPATVLEFGDLAPSSASLSMHDGGEQGGAGHLDC